MSHWLLSSHSCFQFSLSATFVILSPNTVYLEFNHSHPQGSGLVPHPFTQWGISTKYCLELCILPLVPFSSLCPSVEPKYLLAWSQYTRVFPNPSCNYLPWHCHLSGASLLDSEGFKCSQGLPHSPSNLCSKATGSCDVPRTEFSALSHLISDPMPFY